MSAGLGQPEDSAARRELQKLEELFHRVLEVPLRGRAEQLRAWCEGNWQCEQAVLELLAAEASVTEKMNAPAAPGARVFALESDEAFDARQVDLWLGRTLHGYTLEREIGQGGMGVVYLGTRARLEDSAADSTLHSRVAVKVIRGRLRTTPALENFLLERDSLAALQHPHIARLLDGGVTSEGAPFLTIEYVEGLPLDQVCDQAGCSIDEVLRLMLQVCDAVSYVHRKLILHRDLKPGNVMVTGEGEVKLLDFGTLKLLDPETGESAMTQAGMRPMTLRYASPEHIFGHSVSTASDVYSLGVMLYRLVAGRLPDVLKDRTGATGAFLDALREGRLPPPSALATRSIGRELSADLDAIILKAMRYTAEERYATANALASDLVRAMEHRPVEARGVDLANRLSRFYRRHRLPVCLAAVTAAVMMVGVFSMLHQAAAARSEQQRAEAAVDVERQLAHRLLFDYMDGLKQVPSSTDAQRRAVSLALTYLDGLERDPAVRDAKIELDEVRALTRMGNVLGNPYEENLGDSETAIRVLQKAVALGNGLLKARANDLGLLVADAEAHQSLGRVYLGSGKIVQARDEMLVGTMVAERLAAMTNVQAKDLAVSASLEDSLGDTLWSSGQPSMGDRPAAMVHIVRSAELEKAALARDGSCVRCRRGLGVADWKLGLLEEDGHPALAVVRYQDALVQLDQLDAAVRAGAATQRLRRIIEQHLGAAEVYTGQIAAGLALNERVRAERKSASDADPVDQRNRNDFLIVDQNLAELYSFVGRHAEAATMLREAIGNLDLLMKTDPANEAWQFSHARALLLLGKEYTRLHQPEAALEARDDGSVELLNLTKKPDAAAYVLDVAAEMLEETKGDASLELSLSQRAIAGTATPSGHEWSNLARADRRVNDEAAMRLASNRAIAIFSATASGKDAADFEEMRSLAGRTNK